MTYEGVNHRDTGEELLSEEQGSVEALARVCLTSLRKSRGQGLESRAAEEGRERMGDYVGLEALRGLGFHCR